MDLNAIKNKLNTLQSKGKKEKKEKVDFSKYIWKPKEEGKYQIRIVPSKFNKENPFKEIFVHYGFGKFPIYALTNWGEKDPIVEFAKKLREGEFDKDNWGLAKKLDPKMRIFAPVIVRGEEDKGVRLWEFGVEIYNQLLAIASDEDYGDYTDIAEGRDFTLEAVKGDVGGRQGLKSTIRIKPKTSPLSSNKNEIKLWLEEQPDILEVQLTYKRSFDQIKSILEKFLNPEEESQEESGDSEPVDDERNDLPWEQKDEEIVSKKSDSSVKNTKKVSKADKFDALFKEENN